MMLLLLLFGNSHLTFNCPLMMTPSHWYWQESLIIVIILHFVWLFVGQVFIWPVLITLLIVVVTFIWLFASCCGPRVVYIPHSDCFICVDLIHILLLYYSSNLQSHIVTFYLIIVIVIVDHVVVLLLVWFTFVDIHDTFIPVLLWYSYIYLHLFIYFVVTFYSNRPIYFVGLYFVYD